MSDRITKDDKTVWVLGDHDSMSHEDCPHGQVVARYGHGKMFRSDHKLGQWVELANRCSFDNVAPPDEKEVSRFLTDKCFVWAYRSGRSSIVTEDGNWSDGPKFVRPPTPTDGLIFSRIKIFPPGNTDPALVADPGTAWTSGDGRLMIRRWVGDVCFGPNIKLYENDAVPDSPNHGSDSPNTGDMAYCRGQKFAVRYNGTVWNKALVPVENLRPAKEEPHTFDSLTIVQKDEETIPGRAWVWDGSFSRCFFLDRDGLSHLGPMVYLVDRAEDIPLSASEGELCHVRGLSSCHRWHNGAWEPDDRPVIDRRIPPTPFSHVLIRYEGDKKAITSDALVVTVAVDGYYDALVQRTGCQYDGRVFLASDVSAPHHDSWPWQKSGDLAYCETNRRMFRFEEGRWRSMDLPVSDRRKYSDINRFEQVVIAGPDDRFAMLGPGTLKVLEDGTSWVILSDGVACGPRVHLVEHGLDSDRFDPIEGDLSIVRGENRLRVFNSVTRQWVDDPRPVEDRRLRAHPIKSPLIEETQSLPNGKEEPRLKEDRNENQTTENVASINNLGNSKATTGAPMSNHMHPSKTQVAIEQLKDDAADAGTRVMARQFVKLAKEPAVALLSRNLAPDDEGLRARIATFLETEMGTALMQVLLSGALMAVPYGATGGELASDISRELRVAFMADAGDMLAEVVVSPLREVMTKALAGAPAVRVEIAPEAPSKVDSGESREDARAIPLVAKR